MLDSVLRFVRVLVCSCMATIGAIGPILLSAPLPAHASFELEFLPSTSVMPPLASLSDSSRRGAHGYERLGADGAATYTVALGAVSADYDSSRPRQPWTVGQVGAITRSHKWGPPRGTPADRFLLDGEPLICATHCDVSGEGVERIYHAARQEYRRIRFVNPGTRDSYWQVIDPRSGMTATYGRESLYASVPVGSNRGSRQYARYSGSAGEAVPRAWALERVVDAGGHLETLYYYEREPARNDAGGIDFALHRVVSGRPGKRRRVTRLERGPERRVVAVEVLTAAFERERGVVGDSAVVARHELSWREDPAGRALLESVVEHGSDGLRGRPLRFEYTAFQDRVQVIEVDAEVAGVRERQDFLGGAVSEVAGWRDVDGDGVADWLSEGLRVRHGQWDAAGYALGERTSRMQGGGCVALREQAADGAVVSELVDLDGDGALDCVYAAARWRANEASEGRPVRIRSDAGGCLHDESARAQAVADVVLRECGDGIEQLWYYDPQAATLRSAIDPSKCLVAPGIRQVVLASCSVSASLPEEVADHFDRWKHDEAGRLAALGTPLALVAQGDAGDGATGVVPMPVPKAGGPEYRWQLERASGIFRVSGYLGPELREAGENVLYGKGRALTFIDADGEPLAPPAGPAVRSALGDGGWVFDWVELDGDGRADLVEVRGRTGGEASHVFWRNEGDGRFRRDAEPVRLHAAGGVEDAAALAVATSLGGGWGPASRTISVDGLYRDLDGDGLSDYLHWDDSARAWDVHYNRAGTLVESGRQLSIPDSDGGARGLLVGSRRAGDGTRLEYYDLRDVNGDGLPDRLHGSRAGGSAPLELRVAYNRGAGADDHFGPWRDWGSLPGDVAGHPDQAGRSRLGLPALADRNGDGLLDVALDEAAARRVISAAGVAGGLLQSVSTPQGARHMYDWASRRRFEAAKARHPLPGWVVTEHWLDNGLGDVDRVLREYEGGRYDRATRADLGFAVVRETSADGEVLATHYHQSGSLRGRIEKLVRRAPDESIFDFTAFEYQDHALEAGHYGHGVSQRNPVAPSDVPAQAVSAVHPVRVAHYRVDGATADWSGMKPAAGPWVRSAREWTYNAVGAPTRMVATQSVQVGGFSIPSEVGSLTREVAYAPVELEAADAPWRLLPLTVRQTRDEDTDAAVEVGYRYDDDAHPMQWTHLRVSGPGGPVLETRRAFEGGNLVQVTAPNGLVTETTPDSRFGLFPAKLSQRPPGGVAITAALEYDERGRLVSRRAPGGALTRYLHDGLGRPTGETRDGEQVVRVAYHAYEPGAHGRAARPAGMTLRAAPGGGAPAVERSEYRDGFGRVVQTSTKAGGGRWSHQYHWYALGGRMQASWAPDTFYSDGGFVRPARPDNGAQLSYSGLAGGFGRVSLGGVYGAPSSWQLAVSGIEGGHLVERTWQQTPALSSAQTPPDKPWRSRALFNDAADAVALQALPGPDWLSRATQGEQAPRVEQVLDLGRRSLQLWRPEREDSSRLVLIEEARLETDGADIPVGGSALTVERGDQKSVRTVMDWLRRPVTVVHPERGRQQFTYDLAAGETVITTPLGRIETRVDALGRPRSRSASDGSATQWWYDGDLDGDGRVDSHAEFDRRHSIGRLTGMSSRRWQDGEWVDGEGGSLVYSHDSQGRVIAETRTLGERRWRTQYRYDALGRRTGVRFPGDSRFTDYEYDGRGAVTGIRDRETGRTVLESARFDARGRPLEVTYGNGAQTAYEWYGTQELGRAGAWPGALKAADYPDMGERAMRFRYRYDEQGRVARIEEEAQEPRFARAFRRDHLGRLTSVDPLGQDSPLMQESFAYGPDDSLVSRNGLAYHGGRRPSVAMGHRLVYDAAGNLVRRGDRVYEYDGLGRLRLARTTEAGLAATAPVLHWTFEGLEQARASGDVARVADVAGGGHHGRADAGGAAVDGLHGTAVSFGDGGGSVSTEEDFADYPVDALTFSFWARRDDAIDCGRGGQWRWMLAQEWGDAASGRGRPRTASTSGGPFHVIAEDDDTRGIAFTVVPEGWGGDYDSMYRLWSETGRIEADRWHHYAGSYDAASGEMVLYIDGERVNSEFFEARPIIGDSGGVLSVGAAAIDGCAKGGAFPGAVDDVRIFDEVLAAEQIRALYSAATLVGAWDFTEVGATSVSDLSGNGHAAQLANGALIEGGDDGARGVSFPDGEGAAEVAGFAEVQPREALTLAFWARRDQRLDCGSGAQWRWMLAQEWGEGDGAATSGLPGQRSTSGGPFHLIAEEDARGIVFTVVPEDWDGNYRSMHRLWSDTGRIPAGEWHHYTATYDADADAMHLYIDGERVASKPQTELAPIHGGRGPLTLGARQQGGCVTGGAFPGALDGVRVYSRALSAQAVKALATRRPRGEAGLPGEAEVLPHDDIIKFDEPDAEAGSDAGAAGDQASEPGADGAQSPEPATQDETDTPAQTAGDTAHGEGADPADGPAQDSSPAGDAIDDGATDEPDDALADALGAWDFTAVGATRVSDRGPEGHTAKLEYGATIAVAEDGTRGVSFPASRGHVKLVDAEAVGIDDALTFSFWARGDDTLDCSAANDWRWLLEQRAGPGSSSRLIRGWGPFNVIAEEDGAVTFTIAPTRWGRKQAGLHRLTMADGGLTDGEWHHYAGTYDADSGWMRLYRDGERLAEQRTAGGRLAEARELHGGRGALVLGSNGRGGCGAATPFPGRIDRLRIHRTVLSEQRIREQAGQRPATRAGGEQTEQAEQADTDDKATGEVIGGFFDDLWNRIRSTWNSLLSSVIPASSAADVVDEPVMLAGMSGGSGLDNVIARADGDILLKSIRGPDDSIVRETTECGTAIHVGPHYSLFEQAGVAWERKHYAVGMYRLEADGDEVGIRYGYGDPWTQLYSGEATPETVKAHAVTATGALQLEVTRDRTHRVPFGEQAELLPSANGDYRDPRLGVSYAGHGPTQHVGEGRSRSRSRVSPLGGECGGMTHDEESKVEDEDPDDHAGSGNGNGNGNGGDRGGYELARDEAPDAPVAVGVNRLRRADLADRRLDEERAILELSDGVHVHVDFHDDQGNPVDLNDEQIDPIVSLLVGGRRVPLYLAPPNQNYDVVPGSDFRRHEGRVYVRIGDTGPSGHEIWLDVGQELADLQWGEIPLLSGRNADDSDRVLLVEPGDRYWYLRIEGEGQTLTARASVDNRRPALGGLLLQYDGESASRPGEIVTRDYFQRREIQLHFGDGYHVVLHSVELPINPNALAVEMVPEQGRNVIGRTSCCGAFRQCLCDDLSRLGNDLWTTLGYVAGRSIWTAITGYRGMEYVRRTFNGYPAFSVGAVLTAGMRTVTRHAYGNALRGWEIWGLSRDRNRFVRAMHLVLSPPNLLEGGAITALFAATYNGVAHIAHNRFSYSTVTGVLWQPEPDYRSILDFTVAAMFAYEAHRALELAWYWSAGLNVTDMQYALVAPRQDGQAASYTEVLHEQLEASDGQGRGWSRCCRAPFRAGLRMRSVQGRCMGMLCQMVMTAVFIAIPMYWLDGYLYERFWEQ